jgi:hypothetical protein
MAYLLSVDIASYQLMVMVRQMTKIATSLPDGGEIFYFAGVVFSI